MIPRLRRKFTLINLLLVGMVLTVGLALLLAANARRLETQTHSALEVALELGEGDSPPRLEVGADLPGQESQDEGHSFLTPFFLVEVQEDEVTLLSSSGQLQVSQETARQAAELAMDSGQEAGVLKELHLRYLIRTQADGSVRIAFADLSWESDTMGSLLLTCLLIWGLAMAAFFFISRFLATLALKPVERAWQQQRQFVADASHELKTPLTVILASTDIILSHPSDLVSDQAKWLTNTREEARQMKGLVEDLLFLAKSDDARLAFHPMETDLSQLVEGCLLPFEPVAFEAGVALESRIEPDLTLVGDEGQLRRLVRILLDNAVKYAGPPSPAVTVILVRQQDKLRLTVHNTGEPIPPEHLPHLFERFYRADPSRDRAQGGYGLGLAIASSIVQSHRGRLTVTSTREEGTAFTVLLPRG